MITFKYKGDWSKTTRFLRRAKRIDSLEKVDKLAQEGVRALMNNTPVDTGVTAASWTYQITQDDKYTTIEWLNTNVVKGINIAIILQYGHATGTGGYVQGRDYINPAIRPIFERIENQVWKEVVDL